MILVLLGTQNNQFVRIIEEIENCVKDKTIEEEVIVQAGFTKFTSKDIKIIDFIAKEEIEKYIEKASFVITHGGVGSIIGCLKKNKKVIAVPRLKEYKEHVNNHQMQIVENFNKEGYLIGIEDTKELRNAVEKIEKFKPKKYESNTTKIIKIIDEFIEKN